MRIKKTILITFSVRSEKFDSNYERNKFFRELYGWKQTVPAENKTYEYHRDGLLDEMPHKRVGQSSFIIQEDNFDRMTQFFEEWHKKVIWKTFKLLLNDKEIREMFEDEEEVE